MADDQKDKERLKKALDAMIFLPHLKDRQAQSVLAALIPDDKAPRATGRPWDRGDLFRRLKTFKSSTWFAKPNSISPEECARRGWQNTDIDVITCESCKAVVSCPIPIQLLPDEAQQVAEKYAKQVCDSHAVGCPWRSTTCSLSLLHFPHMPKSAVGLDFAERTTTLQRVLCLPPIDPAAVETLCAGPLGSIVAQVIENGPLVGGAGTALENQKNKNDNSSINDALLTSNGVATCEQEAYTRRLRAIALCGWGLEILSSSSQGEEQSAAAAQQCRVGPESSMLSCALCGARAGLWTNFPQCTPQNIAATALSPTSGRQSKLQAHAVSKTAVGKVGQSGRTPAKPIPTLAGTAAAKSPLQSPGTIGSGGSLHRHVAVNVATTIAGGSIDESWGNGGGVFGRSPPLFGAPVFGGVSPPPLSSSAAIAAAAAAEGESVPAFGFAALRAAEPGATNSSQVLVHQGAKRRRDDAAWVEATLAGEDAGYGSNKRQHNTTAKAPHATEATIRPPPSAPPPPPPAVLVAPVPPQSILQEYRSMQTLPLDPIALHRPFCPWVHAAGGSTGSTSSTSDRAVPAVLCGWQWCAQQLGPETSGLLFGSPGVMGGGGGDQEDDEDGHGVGDGGRAAAWNPAAVLRNALSKVEVKKS
ncbi:hypothetical protein Ndes2526B_g08673 [Nannochloris sp. 'desiccata']|nr:hypothetical protein KSW81_001741 [Chlorella desiccata (nom. nud.)]KAH7616173.1 putative Nuclear-interacting partner of ALK [Chlorella desiccata (nom. nud.)]KAH7616582.1 putative Nuclear-interacting partner of ALK [Chlorella desiccata (nom. nud.)]